MNKLFAVILVAGAITFTSCDKKVEEKKADTEPVKEEVKAPVVDEKATEMKADTTKKDAKKPVIVEEEKKDKK